MKASALLLLTSIASVISATLIAPDSLVNVQPIISRDNGSKDLAFFPEGIEFVDNRLVVSSLTFGTITMVNPKTGMGTTLVAGGREAGTNPDFYASIGLFYERRTRLLFIAQGDIRRFHALITREKALEGFGPSSIVVVDLNSHGKPSIKDIDLSQAGSILANDLTYDPRRSRLFVTDTFGKAIYQVTSIVQDPPQLHKLPPTKPMVSLFANDDIIQGTGQLMGLSGPNGIVYHPRNFLLVARSDGGNSGIVRYDLDDRSSRGASTGSPVLLLDQKGNRLDGKLPDNFNFDGIALGQQNSRLEPNQLFVVVAPAVLRFVSFDNYRSLTLVQKFNLSKPGCNTATTGKFGPDDKFFVSCTDFTNPAANGVVTIDVPPLHKVPGFTQSTCIYRAGKRRYSFRANCACRILSPWLSYS